MTLRITFITVLFFYSVGYASTSGAVEEQLLSKIKIDVSEDFSPQEEFKPTKRQAKSKRLSDKKKGKRWFVAVLLSFPLFAWFLIGSYRFYLGYDREGVAQCLLYIAGLVLLIMTAFAGGTLLLLVELAAVIPLATLTVWVLIDFIRILFKTLKPKNGEYR